MRRPLLLATIALLVVACSPSEAGDSTTLATTSTSVAVATTTTEAAASTSEATTTTEPTTTTTTIEETTTTSEGLEGNWAEEPLITTGFGALGWWDGSSWVSPEDEGGLPVAGGENYQIALIGLEAITTGGPQELVCPPLDNYGVTLDNENLLGEWPGPYGVAISASWELQPHLFESISDDGTYAAFARELLATRGLDVPNPMIKQLYRTDLEGDGTNEVIVVAEEITGGFFPEEGDYSIIFMRKVVEGEVQTAILGDSVITDPEGAFLVGYTLGAVADLNGDGQMEIVVASAYFEGLGVEVWEYVNDDLGPVVQLQIGCGS